LIFGGETEAALKRAAQLGDGWYGVGHSPESAGRQVQRLRALLSEAGRSDHPFELTVSCGTPVVTASDVQRYREAGIDRIVVLPWQRGREAEEKLRKLADDLLPH
jgi:alkanesulfonate monooxygenase SsuD/methylene tetrahydromethanopterin reductase-like flavin-dependent oxidoreductase (luciferase family)